MKAQDDKGFEAKLETNRRHEKMEMHLFDKNDSEEEALCKDRVHVHDLLTVQHYMESRMDGVPVGTVCERCKALAVPFAANHCQELEVYAKNFRAKAERQRERDAIRYRNSSQEADLEADQLVDEATEYRRLVDRLAKQTGLKRSCD